jgi:PAS domain S-box-containing protein
MNQQQTIFPASEAGFDALFQCTTVGLILINKEGRIQHANPYVDALFGYTLSELKYQPVNILFPQASIGLFVSHFNDYFNKPEAHYEGNSLSLTARKKDGSEFPVNVSLSYFHKDSNNFAIAFITDMTEKKLLEEKFATLFYRSPAAKIYCKSGNKKITDVNDSFCRLCGYTKEELIGQTIVGLGVVSADEWNRVEDIMNREGSVTNFEVEFKNKNRQPVFVLLSAEQIEIAGVKYLLSSSIDITEHKKLNEALLASTFINENEAAELKKLNDAGNRLWQIDNLQEGLEEILGSSIALTKADKGNIQIYDPGKKVLHIVAQKGFEQEFLDYFREATAADHTTCGDALRSRTQMVTNDTEKEWSADDAAMAAKSGFRAVISTPLLKQNGTPIGIISTHFRNAGLPPVGILKRMELYALNVENFIERVRIHESLEKQNLDLEQKVKERTLELTKMLEQEREFSDMKSRFVSMASHEFRTPLTVILLNLELVEFYNLDDQKDLRNRHIARIKASITNMVDILNDFLSLDKLEQRKVETTPEIFDLDEFAKDIIEEVKGMLKQGQHISFLYSGEKEILQDKKILKNVMLNLLSNAIKYSPENTVIHLSIHVEDHTVLIEVEDHGIGIPKEEQSNLFEKFFRASNAKQVQGTGIGLNIVKRYVELLKGTICFNSKVNEGSTFTVTFPKNIN